MKTLPPPIRAFALGTLVLLATGCGDDDQEAGSSAGAPTAGQELEGVFQPREGETWTYRVQKQLPLDVELAEEDQARHPERTDSGYVVTFERIRSCTGTRRIEGADEKLTAMEIIVDGQRLGEELYDIGPEGVFFRGWRPAEGGPRSPLLPEGVKLVTPGLQPGQSWTSAGADPNRHFQFRVVERTEIDVPAGTFEAVRIQITSEYRGAGLKRTIWFAENIGIVKEEAVSYGPQRTRVRERSELVHFVVPSGSPPADHALVTSPDSGNAEAAGNGESEAGKPPKAQDKNTSPPQREAETPPEAGAEPAAEEDPDREDS